MERRTERVVVCRDGRRRFGVVCFRGGHARRLEVAQLLAKASLNSLKGVKRFIAFAFAVVARGVRNGCGGRHGRERNPSGNRAGPREGKVHIALAQCS